MIDLTPIFEALITIAASLIAAFLVPWLREKCGCERLERIKVWVRAAAAAAEQLYKGSGRGGEKLEYVLDFLESRGFGLDRDSLEKLVEAELYALGIKQPD